MTLADEIHDADRVAELEQALVRAQRATAKAKARTSDLIAAVYQAARDSALAHPSPRLVPPPPAKRTRKTRDIEVALIHATDWQHGKVTDTYNMEISAERIARLATKTIQLAEIQRADHPVDECHVMFGGDMVEGTSIFPGQCVDPATEALTPQGWKRVDELAGQQIAVFDPTSNELRFELPERINRFPYSGTLLHYKGKAIDHLVTPNHRLWVKTRSESPWHRREAATVRTSGFYVRTAADSWSGLWTAPPVQPTEKCPGWQWSCNPFDLAEFIGWFVAEGSTKSGEVAISQSRSANPDNWERIALLAKRLSETMPGQAGRSIHISMSDSGVTFNSTALSRWVGQFKPARADSARLPDWVRAWPAEMLHVLLEAMIDGDGTRHPNGTSRQLTTTSPELADHVTELAAKLGYSCHVGLREQTTWNIRGESGVQRHAQHILTLSRQERTLKAPVEGSHVGEVWCPTVSTGLWFARRNGQVVVTGNSWEVEASLFGQMFSVVALQEQLVRTLLAAFSRVVVWEEYGNHGRIGRPGDYKASDNIDRMTYAIARERLSAERRLTWNPTTSWHQIVEIGAYRALLVHGDEIKSFGGSVPAFGILRKCNAWATGVVAPFHDVYMGHFHTPMSLTLANGGRVFVTGSPESDNQYAKEFMAATGEPSQRLHFIHPVRGRVTSEHVIFL